MIRPRGPVAALTLLTLAVLPLGAQTPPAPPKGSPEQRQTISDIRNVGTAMFVWYKDQLKTHPKGKTEQGDSSDNRAVLGRIPTISHDDLAKLLVPKYIAAIPEKDGWGHPYEFHLSTADLDAKFIMGLRSAGQDGAFADDSYQVGAFPPADQDQDIVWMDGYFVRWPQPPAQP